MSNNKLPNGAYVSRSTYQKVVEENKRLLADIKILVQVDKEKYVEVQDKWEKHFKKESGFYDTMTKVLQEAVKPRVSPQPPRSGRIHYGGHRQHTVHYVIADDNKEMIKVSRDSVLVASERMVAKQKQMKSEGYEGPFGLPHHCFSFNQAVTFTLNEAGEAVILFD